MALGGIFGRGGKGAKADESEHMELTTVAPTFDQELESIAELQQAGRGWLMRGVQTVGSLAEGMVVTVLKMTPETFEQTMAQMLRSVYEVSARADQIERIRNAETSAHGVAVMLSGAGSGLFGLAGILPDLAFTTTVIFNGMQNVARQHGFDPQDERIRRACLMVFASGGPGSADDAVESSFVVSRIALNGLTLEKLLARASSQYVSRLLAQMGPKAIPILGALSGVAINKAFMDFYLNVAEVQFRLMALERDHPGVDVASAYRQKLAAKRGGEQICAPAQNTL